MKTFSGNKGTDFWCDSTSLGIVFLVVEIQVECLNDKKQKHKFIYLDFILCIPMFRKIYLL